jgi:selenide, water dikinase
VLPAAREYVNAGIAPGGTHANWRFLSDWVTYETGVTKEAQLLLCDAQTSGGLLAAVPDDKKQEIVSELRKAGVAAATIVGRIEDKGTGRITVAASPA